MTNSKSDPKMYMTYLFNGEFKKTTPSGQLEIIPGTASPIKEQWIAASQIELDDKGKPLPQNQNNMNKVLWLSDKKGLLKVHRKTANTTRAARVMPDYHDVCFVPKEIPMRAFMTHGEKEWSEPIHDFFKKNLGKGHLLAETWLRKKDLRGPAGVNSSQINNDDEYRNWYKALPDDQLTKAIVVAKTKSILFLFSSPSYGEESRGTKGLQLIITDPCGKNVSQKALNVKADEKVSYCVVSSGDSNIESNLPTGLYTIKVMLNGMEKTGLWSKAVRSTGYYVLKEMVRFGISNPAGDFDIIHCDPISLEEAMLQQHASQYSHYLDIETQASTTYSEKSALSPEERAKRAIASEFAKIKEGKPIQAVLDKATWTRDKFKFALGLIDATSTSKRAWSIGKMLSSVYGSSGLEDTQYGQYLQSCIDLVFTYKGLCSNVNQLNELFQIVSTERKYQFLLANLHLGANPALRLKFASWWGDKMKTIATGKDLAEVEKAKLCLVDLQQIEGKKELAMFIKKGTKPDTGFLAQQGIAGSALGKMMLAVDCAEKVWSFVSAIQDISGTKNDLTKNVNSFDDLLAQLKKELNLAPCREAIGLLEKVRLATVTGQLQLEKKEADFALAALDAALGVASLIPVVGAYVQIFVLAKDIASGLWTVYSNYLELADEYILKNVLASIKEEFAFNKYITGRSDANQKLIPSDKDQDDVKNLDVQFRSRAEAIDGLFGLLGRAGVSAKSDEAYIEQLKKLRVKEYIEQRILADGWGLALRKFIPVGCDADWLYQESVYTRTYSLPSAHRLKTLKDYFGTNAALRMSGSDVFDKYISYDEIETKFHTSFPIHRMESKSVKDFARMFRVHFMCQIDEDCIACTAIYRRPPGSKNDSAWEIIQKDKAISPFDQIRIFIVLDKKITSGVYPVNVRLCLVGGEWLTGISNIEGPAYLSITRVLSDLELLLSEIQFKGRLGCVVYPFYMLAGQRILGVKPMASFKLAEVMDENFQVKFEDLQNMKYSYQLTVGSNASKCYIKPSYGLSGIPEGKGVWSKIASVVSPDDEICMSVSPSQGPNAEKMLSKAFLYSENTTYEYPKMFDPGHVKARPCYVRVGGKGPYFLDNPKHFSDLKEVPQSFIRTDGRWIDPKYIEGKKRRYIHIFDDFDWNQRVEFVVLMLSTIPPDISEYEKLEIDWKKIPARIRLRNIGGILGDDGPGCDSILQYIGRVSWHGRGWNYPGVVKKASDNDLGDLGSLKEWVSQILDEPQSRDDLYEALGTMERTLFRPKQDGYLFAAHFEMKYVTPNGQPVTSIRPFGTLTHSQADKNEYYQYQISRITTLPNNGIDLPCEYGTGRDPYSPIEFHFRAPTKQEEKKTPWGNVQDIKKWIEDRATELNCAPQKLL